MSVGRQSTTRRSLKNTCLECVVEDVGLRRASAHEKSVLTSVIPETEFEDAAQLRTVDLYLKPKFWRGPDLFFLETKGLGRIYVTRHSFVCERCEKRIRTFVLRRVAVKHPLRSIFDTGLKCEVEIRHIAVDEVEDSLYARFPEEFIAQNQLVHFLRKQLLGK